MRRVAVAALCVALLFSCARGGADECRNNSECGAPWSRCWTLGWCAAGHCLYSPLLCSAGSGCQRVGCVPAAFTLAVADANGRFRLTLTNTSGAPASVTIDPRRVIVDDVDCTPAPPEVVVASAPPPAKPQSPQRVVAGGRIAAPPLSFKR